MTKVQGYNRGGCFRGRDGGLYRALPNGAIVPCRREPEYRGPPIYAPPVYRSQRRDRREVYCAAIYNQCYARYGRGSSAYVYCMQSQGC